MLLALSLPMGCIFLVHHKKGELQKASRVHWIASLAGLDCMQVLYSLLPKKRVQP